MICISPIMSSQLKVNTGTWRWVCSSRVYNRKLCFQFGMEGWQPIGVTKSTMPFQTFRAAIQNVRLAVSVRVHGTERRRASVDRRVRVVTWHCRSSSMYGAERKSTEPYAWWPPFCTGCAVGQAAIEETGVHEHICAADRWPGRRCFEISAASRRL